MIKNVLIWALSTLLLNSVALADCITIRGVLDIGSGATKMKVAKIDQCQQKILKILAEDRIKVAYSADLKEQKEKTGLNRFSESIISNGLIAINLLMQKGNEAAKVDAWSGFATSAFRNATNGKKTLAVLSSATGVSLHLITQDEEGTLGYMGGMLIASHDPKTTIVWDIGGGSQQFSYRANDGSIKVVKLEDRASEKFKEIIIREIKKISNENIKTPNPIGVENIEAGVQIGRDFAENLKLPFTPSEVIGIGGVHAKSIPDATHNKESYSLQDLKVAELQWAPKDDVAINDPFADTFVSNIFLVDGMMQGLCFDQVTISPYNITDAALIYSPFW